MATLGRAAGNIRGTLRRHKRTRRRWRVFVP